MIRRPKRLDYQASSVAATVHAAAASAGDITRGARTASSRLARAAILLLLLQLLLLPVLVWLQADLPAWASLVAVYAALGLAAATFWTTCGRPELSRRLSLKRKRLEELDDTAAMRTRLLAEEAAAARSAPPPSPRGEPQGTE